MIARNCPLLAVPGRDAIDYAALLADWTGSPDRGFLGKLHISSLCALPVLRQYFMTLPFDTDHQCR
jgi:hypothetical protein